MAAPASSEVFKRSTNRRLYTWVAIGAALTVFAGFARTYYLKSFYTTPSPNHPVLPALLHIHGLVMTTWVVLFIVQVRLVAAHRADLHRKLGVAGAILAGLVVAINIDVSLRSVHRLFTTQAGSTRVLGFLASERLTDDPAYDGKETLPPRKYFPLSIVTKHKGNRRIAVMHNLLCQPLPPGAITWAAARPIGALRRDSHVVSKTDFE
jgi:hypothetical protein